LLIIQSTTAQVLAEHDDNVIPLNESSNSDIISTRQNLAYLLRSADFCMRASEDDEYDYESSEEEFRMMYHIASNLEDKTIKDWMYQFRLRSRHVRCFNPNCVLGTLTKFTKEDLLGVYESVCKDSSSSVQVPLSYTYCKKCKCARYCSRKCLVKDWNAHKEDCLVLCASMKELKILEVQLRNHCFGTSKKRTNLFMKYVGKFSKVAESRNYCMAKLTIGSRLWSMGIDRNYRFFWREAIDHFQELLRLDQQDVFGAANIFPGLLVGEKEYRKAYMFCLWLAYTQKSFKKMEWPCDEYAEHDSWIWGPICCDKRLLEDPFSMKKLKHDNFHTLQVRHYRTGSLLALALLKHILTYSDYVDVEENPEYKTLLDKQLGYMENILLELKNRDEGNPEEFEQLSNPRSSI
jgi:hypothetical protein